MGTRMFAQAVLLATSVTKVDTTAMMKLTRSGSSSLSHSSCTTMYSDSPDLPVMSARANPPPSSRITPHGSFFSTGPRLV